MSFAQVFNPATIRSAVERSAFASPADVRAAVACGAPSLQAAAALLSPAASSMLEELAQTAHRMTIQRFGKTIALYAPLYLSNDCVCTCTYCGFSMGLEIKRRTLRIDEVMREAGTLAQAGFRNVLLVSSEHPKYVNTDYLAQCVGAVKSIAQYVALEVAAARTHEYERYVAAGCDGVVLYQETYDPDIYVKHHLGGPKKKFSWRLDAPERAAQAGIRHLGLGALLGLADWRFEGLALLEHVRHLARRGWRSQVNISFPRINAAAGGFVPERPVTDAALVQLICALRIALPTAGIVLSTRESPHLRDNLVSLGVTQMSAGSRTEPGGYNQPGSAGEQFHLEDGRSPLQVAERLRELGYDPVFKDWETMSEASKASSLAAEASPA